jgi:peptide/nickel transport system permease protein
MSRTSVEADVADDGSILSAIRTNPRPAVVWGGIALLLILPQFGALVSSFVEVVAAVVSVFPGDTGNVLIADARNLVGDVPTLLSRETIPNRGYYDGSQWQGTFAGWEPKHAWLLRVGLVYAYAFIAAWWVLVGYRRFRRHYRISNWTPFDDVLDRFSDHTWGHFGLVVVIVFVVMVLFAPTLGTTTVQENIINPYSHEISYYDAESGSVEQTTIGTANRKSTSTGGGDNVGPWTYDDYGRFHPFGTLPSGKDLFTFITAGARVSLVIGLVAIGLSGLLAVSFALLSAYYRGLVDLAFVVSSDSVMGLPQLLVLLLLSVLLSDTWIGGIYSGGLVLALIYGAISWPFLWRALRGPALQTAGEEWVDAARNFGQTPHVIMRKHILPYIAGYLLVYGSMSLGGAIIAIAGLSFLGLGIDAPTPEWGRAVNAGQEYVASESWHISLIPGLLITILVTGFNALGDGVRDAIDPQSDVGSGSQGAAGGGA